MRQLGLQSVAADMEATAYDGKWRAHSRLDRGGVSLNVNDDAHDDDPLHRVESHVGEHSESGSARHGESVDTILVVRSRHPMTQRRHALLSFEVDSTLRAAVCGL
jgi:hypothetical protein